jgi:hypothetical protein
MPRVEYSTTILVAARSPRPVTSTGLRTASVLVLVGALAPPAAIPLSTSRYRSKAAPLQRRGTGFRGRTTAVWPSDCPLARKEAWQHGIE